ncbi:MAG: HlyD family efflux transporter periplasmic adaptor subunit [Dysgonamonadaceae bacterium]|jgi:HlyD family secretion protein|nr:HlyD family efflux transporter periplasmic adaptor subunit [Dysgonamonadaceae bacterium]
MNTRIVTLVATAALFLTACNRNEFKHDASGTFEATETIVSAEGTGKIEELNIVEGDMLTKGQCVGYIDTTQLYLKKLQLEATDKAILTRRVNVPVQIASVKEQIAKAESDKRRIDNLFADGAATQKQVDDLVSQIAVLKSNLAALQNQLSVSVSGINEESSVIAIQVAQIEDMMAKCRIVNPLDGTVLNKYAEAKEMASTGKFLYKIADTKRLFLRAYVVASQLLQVKTGQVATVFINDADDGQRSYPGVVSWISDKAEFTPKTIQTKDERQNLVYAVKIAVENTDGLIKIGMYGDVDFKSEHKEK